MVYFKFREPPDRFVSIGEDDESAFAD